MKIIVFTDLDATLLDATTYSWQPACGALDALRRREGALVLVSSKTLPEMEPLHRELHFGHSCIVENGGGIAAPLESAEAAQISQLLGGVQPLERGDFSLFPLGKHYVDLVEALEAIAAETGCGLRGFAAMSPREVARITGLSLEAATKAKNRDFDEPFLMGDSAPAAMEHVRVAASERGLSVVKGGRFWHLIGHGGKGHAVALVQEAHQRLFADIFCVGLGDSPNDFSFLELMDLPVLVGARADGDPLPRSLMGALQVAKAGPEGWNEAILGILARWAHSWAQA
jgi:mannosyl-3-phosphoglycerate phosphatase